jgi:ABC-type multidrug transport system fused ATPase/permease subunit
MVFEMASTNLVFELGIIMLVLLGWQLTLAEFVGAPIMVVVLVFLFRTFLDRNLLERAKEQAESRDSDKFNGLKSLCRELSSLRPSHTALALDTAPRGC